MPTMLLSLRPHLKSAYYNPQATFLIMGRSFFLFPRRFICPLFPIVRSQFNSPLWFVFLTNACIYVFSSVRVVLKSQNSASPAHPVLPVNVQCGVTASNVAPFQWSTMTDSATLSILTTHSPPPVSTYRWIFLCFLSLCLLLFFLLPVSLHPKL